MSFEAELKSKYSEVSRRLGKFPPVKVIRVPIVADATDLKAESTNLKLEAEELRNQIAVLMRRVDASETINNVLAQRLEAIEDAVKPHKHIPFDPKECIIRPTRMQICICVASHFHTAVEDILSRRQDFGIVPSRQIAMYLVRKFTASSLPEIAAFFSRDHTTVLFAYRKICVRRGIDPQLDQDIRTVERALGVGTIEEENQ